MSKYMGRKFINRYKNENYDQEYEEEEENNKKRMERVGPNIDDVDAMDVEIRQISLEKNMDKPRSREEIIKEELQVAGHQTRTTNQFQKYINAHIEDRLSRIDKIKQAKQAFDKDIEALKGDEFQYLTRLKETKVETLSSKAMQEMLHSLTLNKDITKSKLEHFKNRVKETEQELTRQEKDIERIEKRINEKMLQEKEEKVKEESIKKDLAELSKKYNVNELRKILQSLSTSEDE
ncbi:MAG: hypothetical protein DWQ18_06205 [Crenarchaeota archaeon]|nr:MAG: hypothetical protein DWQ17_03580 [Thermoproteota archaeon]RDJ32793.1 MAG: hypothetical protein DWQ18_06205 [Thermoproteota archaeon]